MGKTCSKILKVDTLKQNVPDSNDSDSKIMDVTEIMQEKNFKLVKIIESGFFGVTISIEKSEDEAEEFVKISKGCIIGTYELDSVDFTHDNLNHITSFEYLPHRNIYLLYSTPWELTLEEKVKNTVFREDPSSIAIIMKWIQDISKGLEFLQDRGYCHLDLCPRNVVINGNQVAKIRNFYYMGMKQYYTER